MAKMLLKQAAKYYKDKGDLAISYTFLSGGCRSGTLPHMRIGNRYVVDTEQLEEFFKKQQAESLHQELQEDTHYGKLRRIHG